MSYKAQIYADLIWSKLNTKNKVIDHFIKEIDNVKL